jgi:AraC-like DNA-binding protein
MFTYSQPPSIALHRTHFRCPLVFEAPAGRIVFDPSDLDRPVIGADETLARYLSKYAEHVLDGLIHGATITHTVHAVVWSLLGDGPPSLARVAAVLRMSPRTLQRRLAREGTSLHREIDEIRKQMAIAVLRDRSIATEDVAFLLGYSETSTFFRSFKRWTGTTPRQFRDAIA